ncbi:MAG: hypothetical protein HN337_02195 [Deltaproteobacteria bacterium]|jgi:cold shock CspA family protein|nr:hypothetical protein [Deltaproteobacteria bacterium]
MTIDKVDVEVRAVNWLPLPCDIVMEDSPSVEEDDLFPKGEVMSFHPKQGYGEIKNVRGELIGFRMEELEMIGPKGDAKYLSEGKRVGYDVGWTSHGMHITKIKVY